MGRLFLIAVRNLRQHAVRTALLAIAIVSVTSLLVVLNSVGNGIQRTMLRAATTLSTGHVNVAGFYKITSGQAAPMVVGYKPLIELVEKEVPEATVIVDRLRGWGKIVSVHNNMQLGIGGVDIDQETGFHDVLQILEGDINALKQPDTALIFAKQAESLEVGIGDVLTISTPTVRGAQNSEDVTVGAIAKDIGLISGFSIFVGKPTLRKIYLLDDRTTGAIQIYLDDVSKSSEVAERLRKAINAAGFETMDPLAEPFWRKFPLVTREDWTGQKIDVTTWEDEMKFLTYTLDAFNSLTFTLGFILLLIIIGGVMNSMLMAVRERTQEIGTLRAIGMGRRSVALMILLEAAVLTGVSSILGAMTGAGIAALLNSAEIKVAEGFELFLMRDTLQLHVNVGGLVLTVLAITIPVTIFALYPALRAAWMRPVTAMQHAG
ncbi:MAG: putative ABC transport system permease protein [Myxococcota bacterium]|jgi:putative ABC transport system permease protein